MRLHRIYPPQSFGRDIRARLLSLGRAPRILETQQSLHPEPFVPHTAYNHVINLSISGIEKHVTGTSMTRLDKSI